MTGEKGAIKNSVSLPVAMVLAGLFAISEYNSLEIYIFIFRTFRRRRRLYFWSAICANTGILLLSLFLLLRFFGIVSPGPISVFLGIVWWCMVTGQSLMLYSRLNLVMCDPRKLRWLLCMIVAIFLFIQIPVAILFVLNTYDGNANTVTIAYNVMEKTELVVITVEEAVLSGLYLYEWASVRKELEIIRGRKVRQLFHELIGLFIVVVVLDISLTRILPTDIWHAVLSYPDAKNKDVDANRHIDIVSLQFSNLFYIQATYKPLVYSIKLKVETYVLNELVKLMISRDSFQHGTHIRHASIPSTTTIDDDPWRSQHARSLSAARGMVRHGSETSAQSRSLSTMSTGNSCTLKLPRDILSV
ncbi:hypothetical protein F5Y12DRAFT_799878 [Xylaria sp. FL1777]|nr:hypothetical protein F5Y12DRAFT_799878 [Xylaria sp. FL1777]